MREILFRGKREDNGEWIEGYYGVKGKGTDLERHYIVQSTFDSNTEGYPFYFTDILLLPETVCQYTGLTDKNGRKIFEGDIVKVLYTDGQDDGGDVVEVKYSDKTASFCPWDWQYECDGCCLYFQIKEVEVVGNRFDKE